MRTSHSSLVRSAVAVEPDAVFPAQLSPVLLFATLGAEPDLQLRLLDSHPAIHARADEPLSIAQSAEQIRTTMAAMAGGALRDASMSLRRGVASPLRVFCASVSPQSAADIDHVLASLPGVRALGLIRDGRDVVVHDRLASLRAASFEGLSPAAQKHAVAAAAFTLGGSPSPAGLFCAESLRVHTMRWIASLRAPLRAAELLGDRSRVIRTEDLVQETIRTHASLCRWLGVAGDAAHVHIAAEACRSLLAAAPRPGTWRVHMTEADRTAFKRMAGELLVELGYERNTRW